MSDVNDASETDGCEEDFAENADDELTSTMRPLFPGDTGTTKEQWEELFPDGPPVEESDAS